MDNKIAGRVIATPSSGRYYPGYAVPCDIDGTYPENMFPTKEQPFAMFPPDMVMHQVVQIMKKLNAEVSGQFDPNPDIDWASAREEFSYMDSTPCTT